MYAVVAPGFSCIYTNWKDVERVKALYPYPKFIKCRNESEAYEFIKRNQTGHFVNEIYNYGSTFKNFYVTAKYKICEDCVYYTIDTKRVGLLRISRPDFLIEYRDTFIYAKLTNFHGSNESLFSHMSAIFHLLEFLGPYLDINLSIEYFSVFYCLTMYPKGKNRAIRLACDSISRRLGKVAYTLNLNEEDS